MKTMTKKVKLALAVMAGILAFALSADAKPSAPRDEASPRLTRKGAAGHIDIRAGRKHFPKDAEVSIERARPDDVKRKIHEGWGRRHRKGASPRRTRLMAGGVPEASPKVLASYDIAIKSGGSKWQPDAGDPVRVTVELDAPVTVGSTSTLGVVHLADDGTVEELESSRYGFVYDATRTLVKAFWFDASGFSVYAITEENGTYSPNRRLYDFYSLDFDKFLEDGTTPNPTYNTYVPRYFTTAEGNKTFRQIIKSGEYLVRPEVLPSPLGRTFVGWYLFSTNKANQTVEGVTYDAEGYATTEFDFTQPIVFADTPDGPEENHGAREFVLRAKFSREGYVIFHEQQVGNAWPITAVRRAAMVESVEGNVTNVVGTVQIDDLKVTYDDTNDNPNHDNSTPRMIFRGWSETPVEPGALTDTNGNKIVILESPYVFSRVKDTEARPRHLFPVFVNISWLTFKAAETGQGATYIPPRYYYQDEGTNAFPVSTRTGYVFNGWWTTSNDVAGVTGVQVSTPAGALRTNFNATELAAIGAWGGKIENNNLMLTNNVTLYGRWEMGKAKYTVVVMRQSVEDSKDALTNSYDFAFSVTNLVDTESTASVGSIYKELTTRVDSSLNQGRDADSRITTADFKGFYYSGCDDAATVKGDGTTVLRVYYDRYKVTYTFNEYYSYTPTTSTSGTQYGIVSGEYVGLTSYNGSWYYYASGYHAYTGTRYTRSGTSWHPMQSLENSTMTGLYGQPLSSFGYEWLISYKWMDNYSGNDATGTGMTYLDSFNAISYPKTTTDNTTHTITTPFFVDGDNGNSEIIHVFQDLNGNYSLDNSVTTYGSANNGTALTFNFTDKFEGFKVCGYTRQTFTATPATQVEDGDSASTQGYTLYVYHERRKFTLTLCDSYNLTPYSTAEVYYGAPLADYLPSAKPTPTESTMKAGYSFTGWYSDQATSTKFNFNTTMPRNNLIAFAGWETEWYLIQIDPNKGQLPAGQSTWFWEPYNGDPIEEYAATTRSYTESLSGTWFYAIQNRAYYGYSDEYVSGEASARGAYYTKDPSDPAIVPDGKRYDQAVNAYRYAGWYEVDPDTGNETLYAFGQPVQRNTLLRLHWKHIGTYRLVYMPGIGTMNETDENESTFNILDAGVYADSSEILVTRTAEPPPGYSFVGWRIRNGDDTVYHPGQSFLFNSAYTVTTLDENHKPVQQLVLDAVYSVVSTVSLTTDANGGWLDPEEAVTLPLAYPNAPSLITNITDTARTVSGMRNNAYGTLSNGDGYYCTVKDDEGNDVTLEFLGWNTKADGTGTHFDGGTFIGVDTLGTEGGANTLYAEWGVKVYFDKNRDAGVWHKDLWQAQSDTYTWDPDKEMYYQNTTLNGYATHPHIALSSTTEDEMFVLWSTNRYTAVDQLTEFDFSQPITHPLTLYARWNSFIRVPFHVVDATPVTPVLKDDEWLNEGNHRFKVGNYTDISFADEPSGYFHDVPATHEYAFTCVSSSTNTISDAADRRIVRLYFNSDPAIRTTYVEYADGTSGPLPNDKEIYVVYYSNPRPIKIGYEKMERNGGLTVVSTNSASAAPGVIEVVADPTNVAVVAKTPMGYPVDSSSLKYYAYAIGETNATSSAQLKYISAVKGTDGDRPVLWMRNTWRGLEFCTGDPDAENAVWNLISYEAQLYVVYFTSQTTVINFKELTVGTEADMSEQFEYVVAVSNVTTVVTNTQTGTLTGGRNTSNAYYGRTNGPFYTESGQGPYYFTASDWTWGAVQADPHVVQSGLPISTYYLQNGGIEAVTLFSSIVDSNTWDEKIVKTNNGTGEWNSTVNLSITRTKEVVTNAQMVVITQRPKEGFRTTNDIGDGAYVYTQTAAATNAAYKVIYTNTREELPVELHVAFSQNGRIDHVDNVWRSETTNDYTVAVALKEDGTFAVSVDDLEAKENTLIRDGADLGDRRFMGIYYGKPDETDGADENKVVIGGKVTSIGFVKPEGSEYYGLYLNGDMSLSLNEYRLYCVYCAMPRIYYVTTGANGALTKRDTVTFEGNPVAMGNAEESAAAQGTLLEVSDEVFTVAVGGQTGFRVPPVLDGVQHASLNRVAFGAGADDVASTNAMDVVTLGTSIRLKLEDSALKWSVDGETWGDFTGNPALYAIYKELGHDLAISKASLASDADKTADSFTVTIRSENLKSGVSYLATGYDTETVTPTADGVITLTITNGSSIIVHSLPNDNLSPYYVTEGTATGYAMTNVTVNGHIPLTPIENGVAMILERDYAVDFTNIKFYTVTFVNEDGTVISSLAYPYGTKPDEFTSGVDDPTKPMDATSIYRFDEWGPTFEPVGSNTTYTAEYKEIKIPQAVQRAADTNIVVTLDETTPQPTPEELKAREEALTNALAAAGIDINDPGYSENDANDVLNAKDPNGLTRWENLVTGTDTNKPPLSTSVSTDETKVTVAMAEDPGTKVDLGYAMLRDLRKYDEETKKWNRVQGPKPAGNPAFNIPLVDGEGKSIGATGLYRVFTLLVPNTYQAITNEIPSTNIIGVLEVVSPHTNTVVAVPWKQLASSPDLAKDITVSNHVSTVNLTDGDSVYALKDDSISGGEVNSIYEMWTLTNGKWDNVTTVSASGAEMSEASDVKRFPRTKAVWVQRQNPLDKNGEPVPFFLVGQYEYKDVEIAVAGGSKADPGYTLVSVPSYKDFSINSLDWTGYAATADSTDFVRVVDGSQSLLLKWSAAQKAWCIEKSGGYITIGKMRIARPGQLVPYETPLKAGTGFWFCRHGGEFTIKWTPAEEVK